MQEIEKLAGILIATTNLTVNMDKAFERRFLYKIEYHKPSAAARQQIWQAMIPEMSEGDARKLAAQFDFSGGQIENIARKRMVDFILSGSELFYETLRSYCEEELLSKGTARIGFGI